MMVVVVADQLRIIRITAVVGPQLQVTDTECKRAEMPVYWSQAQVASCFVGHCV